MVQVDVCLSLIYDPLPPSPPPGVRSSSWGLLRFSFIVVVRVMASLFPCGFSLCRLLVYRLVSYLSCVFPCPDFSCIVLSHFVLWCAFVLSCLVFGSDLFVDRSAVPSQPRPYP
jgi:hypothetical protein